MESKNNISSYRDILDETLESEELKDELRLKDLVKNQILQSFQVGSKECVDQIVERRTKEVSNFLDMLRSASVDDSEKLRASKESYGSWKVKQDTEEFRVMYREGPEGTPFHTLLVEGYVDGPVDAYAYHGRHRCTGSGTALEEIFFLQAYIYKWPQSTVPSFKITSSKCLQRIRIGEQISLVRMKVSWPLSTREAVVHYFEFDYFQDGLVVVLLNSISDLDTISKSTHGFDSNAIPDTDNIVRIDVVGGFALQKVTKNRSYFRTIANMDIKLDVIPPAFINFLSRQLVGSGFKLYKKEVASVSRGDEDFAKALKDPQYQHIREALYSNSTPLKKAEADEITQDGYTVIHEQKEKYDKDIEEREIHSDDHIPKPIDENTRKTMSDPCDLVGKQLPANDDHFRVEEMIHSDSQLRPSEKTFNTERKPQCEIEEIGEEDAEKRKHLNKVQNNQILEIFNINAKKNVSIRPEVEKALNTLDEAIKIIREHKSNIEQSNFPDVTADKPNIEGEDAKALSTSNAEKILQSGEVWTKLPRKECKETSNELRNSSGSLSSRRSGSSSYAREANQSKVAPASSNQFIYRTGETRHVSVVSSVGQTTGPTPEKTLLADNTSNTSIDLIDGENMTKKKSNKLRLCCLHHIY